jgi:hypothetical protein
MLTGNGLRADVQRPDSPSESRLEFDPLFDPTAYAG